MNKGKFLVKSLMGAILAASSWMALFASQHCPLDCMENVSSFKVNKPKHGAGAGEIKRILTTYNHSTNKFTWEHTMKVDKKKNHGFWLVMSPGEHPSRSSKDYAIFYGDGKTNTVKVYKYNKNKKWNSYQNKKLIQTDKLSFNDHGKTLTAKMSIDTNAINDYLGWDSIAFKDRVGIWFKPITDPNFTYNKHGKIKSFENLINGSYDVGNAIAHYCEPNSTAPVPEPSTYALLGLGLLAIVGYQKKKKISHGLHR